MRLIFFPPEALYTASSFAAKRSNVSGNLEKQAKHKCKDPKPQT